VESGTHEELMAREGLFWRLARKSRRARTRQARALTSHV